MEALTVAGCIADITQQSTDLFLLQSDSLGAGLAEAIEEVRQLTAAPLVVLGGQDKQMELVAALAAGADDYVKLPCNLVELTVRIWAVMRRAGGTTNHQNEAPLRSGQLLLNLATHETFLGTHPVHLTATEFRLLHILIKNSGSVVTHSTLESSLWDDSTDSHGLVKKYVQRLRQKLGDSARSPCWIACIHGIGYRFIGPAPATRDTEVNFADKAASRSLAGVLS